MSNDIANNNNNNNHAFVIDSLNNLFSIIELSIKNKKNNILYDLSLENYYNELFLYLKTSIIFHSMATGNHRSIGNMKLTVQSPLYDTVDKDMLRELKLFINTKDMNILKINSHCSLVQKFDDLKISKALETIYGIVNAYEVVYSKDKDKRRQFVNTRRVPLTISVMTTCCTWFCFIIASVLLFVLVLVALGHVTQFLADYFL